MIDNNMQSDKTLIKSIRQKAKQKILYLPHAIRQMARPERMISPSEIRKVIAQGKIIEDYLAIITAYIPSLKDWKEGFEEREK